MEKNQYSFKGRVTKVEKYKVQENVLIQGVKAEKQSYYDSSSEYSGSNGSYVKHGNYHGMRLDMHFSLYDTDKIFYEYNGKKYRIPQHITLDIYDSVKNIWNVQRLSPQKYEELQAYEGKKVLLLFVIDEDSISIHDGFIDVTIAFSPFMLNDMPVTCMRSLYLYEIK